jgi:hypothetical protein
MNDDKTILDIFYEHERWADAVAGAHPLTTLVHMRLETRKRSDADGLPAVVPPSPPLSRPCFWPSSGGKALDPSGTAC